MKHLKQTLKKHLDTLFRDFTFLGGFLFYFLCFLLALTLKQTKLALILFLGFILIFSVSIIIRLFYFVPRPKKELHRNFIERIDASSFPSIHSARIVFLFLISLNLSVNFLVKVFFFLITVAVLYSRIYLKKHYFVDVLVGAIIGIITYLLSLFI